MKQTMAAMMDLRKSIDDVFRNGHTIGWVKPIGYLKHDPTGYSLAVYKPIPRFKRIMLRWCFGLKFEKIKTKSHENSWCENEL